MAVTESQPDRHRHGLPGERGRRLGAWSLAMVAVTVAVFMVAWAVGTFLQLVVFDLDDQESLSEAGVWGYLAGVFLIGLIVAPALAGIVLGARARDLSESRLGTAGIVVNSLIAGYLVLASVVGLVFG